MKNWRTRALLERERGATTDLIVIKAKEIERAGILPMQEVCADGPKSRNF